MKNIAKNGTRQGEWKWTAGTVASMLFVTVGSLVITGCSGGLNDAAP